MLDRRDFLRTFGLGALGAGALGLSGCLPSPSPGHQADPPGSSDQLTSESTVGGVPLVYEESGRAQAFRFDAGFHGQLGDWLTDWSQRTGHQPTQVRTYGAWIDGGAAGGTSWHHAGRAFDIAGINDADGVLVSCREDIWQTYAPELRAWHRRQYWALAASLHLHFAYVLTHLYDDEHRNHIHVDNGVSGAGASSFTPRSRVQNQAVQAICRYLWDVPCEITGTWDGQTRDAAGRVLDQVGISGSLAAGSNWASFLTASIGRLQ